MAVRAAQTLEQEPQGFDGLCGRVLVLCYHAVSETWTSPLAIAPTTLARQVSLLIRRGYRGTTFADAVLDTHSERRFAVTFDDAYASVWTNGLPVLQQQGVPATVFSPTSFIESRKPLAWSGNRAWLDTPEADELRPLTWQQLAALAEKGWEIASHGHSHVRLTTLTDKELHQELHTSRERLARHIATPRTLAYPFGDHDERVRLAVRDAGFEAAAAAPGPGEPYVGGIYRWPRVGVYRGLSSQLFRLRTAASFIRARQSGAWWRIYDARNRRARG